MFFEVRIFDSNGDLRKVVTPKRLSNRFWKKNENALPDFRDNELGGDDWSSKGSKENLKIGVSEDY